MVQYIRVYNVSETNAMHYHMALSIGYIKNFSLRI